MLKAIPETIQFGNAPAWALVEVKDGHARILKSEGQVEIGTRQSCAAGHGPTVDCDLCRGECLGGGEHPPDAMELPAPA